MLPQKLSNGLCSLRPHEDRLTQSCFIEFTPKLAVQKVEFAPTAIRSRRRLTYKEAFALLVGRTSPASAGQAHSPGESRAAETATLQSELKKMWRLASKLRRQRFAHGSLDLNFPEVKVRLDKQGKPIGIEKIHYDISHQLIEEFMLAANEAVARHLSNLQIPCAYRIHEDPDLEKLRDFRQYAQSFGYKVGDVTHRRELQKLLAAVKDKPEEYAINLALLRSLKQARYSPNPVGHYGLAKTDYTHFTSPIRRYPDLVVHRLLKSLLRREPAPSAELEPTAAASSERERNAADAEQSLVEWRILRFLKDRLGDEFGGLVVDVVKAGLLVELDDYFVTGLLPFASLGGDYEPRPAARRLRPKRRRRTFDPGDSVRVVLVSCDLALRRMSFVPAPDREEHRP